MGSPWPAVDAFLAFVLRPTATTSADWAELVRLLGGLAMARHECPEPDHPGRRDDELRTRDEDLRPILSQRFPDLGYYHCIAPLVDGDLDFEQAPTLGDAIDDLVDITKDLQSAVWHRDEGRAEVGAALLAWSFDAHWGDHLRELQVYLRHRLRG